MVSLTPQQLGDLYENLPDNIREAYSSVDTTKALQAIGKKHGIHLDDLGELVSETGLVMLGATHPKDYIRNIARRLEIETEQARAIAQDVNETVFRPLRESLKKIHKITTDEQQQTTDNSQPTTHNQQPTTPNTQPSRDERQTTEDTKQQTTSTPQQSSTIATPKTVPQPEAPVIMPSAPPTSAVTTPKPLAEVNSSTPKFVPEASNGNGEAQQPPSESSFTEALRQRIAQSQPPINDRQQTADNQQLTTNDQQQTIDNKIPTTDGEPSQQRDTPATPPRAPQQSTTPAPSIFEETVIPQETTGPQVEKGDALRQKLTQTVRTEQQASHYERTPAEPAPPASGDYEVDPYREPIE